jgi:hypothetical protein
VNVRMTELHFHSFEPTPMSKLRSRTDNVWSGRLLLSGQPLYIFDMAARSTTVRNMDNQLDLDFDLWETAVDLFNLIPGGAGAILKRAVVGFNGDVSG